MKKLFFFALWLVTIGAFIAGQSVAPPQYSGNWGAFFGITVILGIISFLLMIFFLFTEKSKSKPISVEEKTKSKYDLSFKRIFSRLFLAAIVGVIFVVSMIPFLTIVDGMTFGQKSALGSQNIIKVAILWGVFTALFTFITIWRKHFRMVSVLLIACWVLGSAIVGLVLLSGASSKDCKRTSLYSMPKEFVRSLDLIRQRLNIEEDNTTYHARAFDYLNCLNIQYSEDNTELGTEGLFLLNDPNLQNLQITINPSYKSFDDLSIATILVHELTHVGQYINKEANKIDTGCFKSEAEAFTSQGVFISQLNEEERRSIYSRIMENVDTNPAFQVLLLVDQRISESYNSCLRLQKENNLSTDQFNRCTWEGTENKLLKDIQEDPFYQKQCAGQ